MQTPPTPRELADAFAEILRDWLDDEELAEVNRRNADADDTCCATHDFCDPNEAMLEALERFGIEFEGAYQQELIALINEAWSMARENGFEPAPSTTPSS